MNSDKSRLRHRLIHQMSKLSETTVERTSKLVCEKALRHIDWSNVQTVLSYVPLKNSGEINPRYLTDALGASRIDHVLTVKDAVVPGKKYDVIIVPVVGFNDGGYRIGRGGGWYDRLLAAHPESISIGLAYTWAEVDFTPEPHDVMIAHIYCA